MTINKNKSKHDFLNSVVIINSLTKSAANILQKISYSNISQCDISEKQFKIFLRSMESIREQTAKIESIFNTLASDSR